MARATGKKLLEQKIEKVQEDVVRGEEEIGCGYSNF